MKLKKILVPIDFSDNSITSLKCAVSLARLHQARITIVHAYYLSANYAQESFIDYLSSMAEELKVKINEDIDRLIAGMDGTDLIEKRVIGFSEPIETIVSVSKAEKTDLIVMGRNGSNSWVDKVMGTTAYIVMKRSACPVIAIPSRIEAPDFSRILFAADLKSDHHQSELEFLKSFATLFESSVVVVNVEDPDSTKKADIDEVRHIEDALANIPHQFEVIRHDNPEEALSEYIENHRITLLAMIPHKHSLLESIFRPSLTRKMTIHLRVPLLALK